MKVALGSDHGGYKLKSLLIDHLKKKGHSPIDVGCFCSDGCDYPEFGWRVADLVSKKIVAKGILVCKSGIGYSLVANKAKGIRAALCQNITQAKSSREHNDANVLVLGALYVNSSMAKRMVSTWLKTKALGGRHARRVNQIKRMESKLFR
ncbi:ribose 5-phosphate isomerase B [Candidatus Omnitrophota bacterium]